MQEIYLDEEFYDNSEPKEFKINLEIPFDILSDKELSLNEKLLLGLDYSLKKKLGFNQITNLEIGNLLNVHPNIIGSCRKKLVQKEYVIKKGRRYILQERNNSEKTSDNSSQLELKDKRNIRIPFEIYHHPELKTGEKLLWGEYNSISKGEKYYYAKREYTANRLGVSVESVSNWTTSLHKKGCFSKYEIISGYYTHQRKIITCRFDEE